MVKAREALSVPWTQGPVCQGGTIEHRHLAALVADQPRALERLGCDADALVVGMKLQVRFVTLENGVVIPKFAPA